LVWLSLHVVEIFFVFNCSSDAQGISFRRVLVAHMIVQLTIWMRTLSAYKLRSKTLSSALCVHDDRNRASFGAEQPSAA
jgi:hypothetical protein